MKTTLLIPTLNEIIGMKKLAPRIKPDWVDQIIVVDGGNDGTYEYAKSVGYEAFKQKIPGLRQAYNVALPYIKGDVVITFSPDGNCIPELIPDLVQKMKEGYDMVVCSRYLDHAESEDDDVITAIGNWVFTRTVNLLHGGNYTDAMGIFRAFKTSVIYDLDLDKEESYRLPEKLFWTNLSWEPLLSVRAVKMNMRVGEVPGDEPARIGGDRKLQVLRWGAAYYFQFLWEVFFWREKSTT